SGRGRPYGRRPGWQDHAPHEQPDSTARRWFPSAPPATWRNSRPARSRSVSIARRAYGPCARPAALRPAGWRPSGWRAGPGTAIGPPYRASAWPAPSGATCRIAARNESRAGKASWLGGLQRVQQALVNVLEAAVAHGHDAIACLGNADQVLDQRVNVGVDAGLAAERRQGFAGIPAQRM